MISCCHHIDCKYNKKFHNSRAQQELEDFQTSGPKDNSVPMLNALKTLPLQKSSLLDIGGGSGTIIFELFGRGVNRISYVELSENYTHTFQKAIVKRGMRGFVEIFTGDFVELYRQIPKADVVTLDKVICCYRDYQSLVGYSLQKAIRWYAFTIPMDNWWVRMHFAKEEFLDKFRGINFPLYVHSVASIVALAEKEGFTLIIHERKGWWVTMVFEKGNT